MRIGTLPWKGNSLTFNISSQVLRWGREAVLTLCFLKSAVSLLEQKLIGVAGPWRKALSSCPAPRGCSIFKVEYCTTERQMRGGPSLRVVTAGRVHFGPFVTAAIFPEIPYAKVMFWLFSPLVLIYFLKSRGRWLSLPSPIIPALCLAAFSEHHGVGMIFNGAQQVWEVLGSECGVEMAKRSPVCC